MKEPRAGFVALRSVPSGDAAVADVGHQFVGQARLVDVGGRCGRSGGRSRSRCCRRAGKRRFELGWFPPTICLLDEASRLHIETPTRLFGFRRVIGRAGYPIALRDDAGVLVGPRIGANQVADPLCLVGRDRPVEQIPVMKIPWRSFDREARAHRDGAALALVVIGVDHQAECEFRIGDRAARLAAQGRVYGARFDVDVQSCIGGADRHSDHAIDVVEPEPVRNELLIDRAQCGELQRASLAVALGQPDRVCADDLDELSHRGFVGRDGRSHVILPPSLRNRLMRYAPCRSVGSRPQAIRDAMSSTNWWCLDSRRVFSRWQ